jgi:hypothetical protein
LWKLQFSGLKYLFLLLVFGFGCSKKQAEEHNFYYWKTTYTTTNTEKTALKNNNTKKIYFRLCDIEMSYDKKPHPENVILWTEQPDTNYEYIPVLFIKNDVFESLTTTSELGKTTEIDKQLILDLAKKIHRLAQSSMEYVGMELTELQLDCDWNATTKDAFFYCLESIKKENRTLKLSATIRLYQLKYNQVAGIPPVDKAVIMCYNMGDMYDAKGGNSVFDLDIIEQYLDKKQEYKEIPISFALPIYSWYLAYRNDQFRGIVRNLSEEELTKYFVELDDTHYRCNTNDLSKYQLQAGDVLRFESATTKQLQLGKKMLKSKLPNWNGEIIFFDLDSSSLTRYDKEILD